MKEDFFKFPSTPHIATLSGVDVRSDKVLSESERMEFLRHVLVVEEKIDGANLGISFDSDGNIQVQNRGAYLYPPWSGQWKNLWKWLVPHIDPLFDHLTNQFILFGEWCYARHSVFYDRLPDWFLGFDIYDKQNGQFWSVARRDELLKTLGLAQVPRLAQGRFTLKDLEGLLSRSKIGSQPAEGLYLRVEQKDWLVQRGKLVRPKFVQSIIRHWSYFDISPNRLRTYFHSREA